MIKYYFNKVNHYVYRLNSETDILELWREGQWQKSNWGMDDFKYDIIQPDSDFREATEEDIVSLIFQRLK